MTKCGYHDNNTSAIQNLFVFVHPPIQGYLPPHKKMKGRGGGGGGGGGKNVHFQLCFTLSENCSFKVPMK